MQARSIVVSAPGKVMVSGEYVVLDGAPAIVAAAGARVHVRLSPPSRDHSPSSAVRSPAGSALPPEAVLSRSCAEKKLGVLESSMQLEIDASRLRSDGRKIGLGSSAATAAGVVCAVAAAHQLDLDSADVRSQLLPLALEGHRSIAPEGSGADVAASMLGGLVRFERRGPDDRSIDARPLAWPSGLTLALVWTGHPARTSDLVAKVKALAARDPAAYQHAITPLRDAARRLAHAIESGETTAAIGAADDHGRAMQHLGECADAPIVTPELARAAEIAKALGGAAKPSGAGGGDIAIVFLPSSDREIDLGRECSRNGLTLLSIPLGDRGPHIEDASSW